MEHTTINALWHFVPSTIVWIWLDFYTVHVFVHNSNGKSWQHPRRYKTIRNSWWFSLHGLCKCFPSKQESGNKDESLSLFLCLSLENLIGLLSQIAARLWRVFLKATRTFTQPRYVLRCTYGPKKKQKKNIQRYSDMPKKNTEHTSSFFVSVETRGGSADHLWDIRSLYLV